MDALMTHSQKLFCVGLSFLALLTACTPATSSGGTTTTVVSTIAATSTMDSTIAVPSIPTVTTKYTGRTTKGAYSTDASTWGALNCHDPALFYDEVSSTYYSYSTDANMGDLVIRGLQVRTSKDLINWTSLTTPAITDLATGASWDDLRDWCFTSTDSSGNVTTATPSLWAPCVIKFNGLYYMYYGVNADVTIAGVAKAHAYIGLATSTSPAGPFTHVARIVRSTTLASDPSVSGSDTQVCYNTYYGAIDPSIFWDKDGNMWMNYGSWRSGIALVRLNDSTGLPCDANADGADDGAGTVDLDAAQASYYATNTAYNQSIYGLRIAGGNGAAYEGAQVFYPGGDYYYILISSGDLNTDYSIRLGRRATSESTGVYGLFSDADTSYSGYSSGYDLRQVRYAANTTSDLRNFHAHGTKVWGSYVFGNELGWRAPGGMSVLKTTDGKWLMAAHVRTNFYPAYFFYLQVHQFYFTDAGWLVVNPNEYAGETLAALTTAQVAGNYDSVRSVRTGTYGSWTNYQGDAYTTVNVADAQETASKALTLGSDGTISGGFYTGTWSLDGYKITLVLKDTSGTTLGTYTGVVTSSYDFSREKLVSSAANWKTVTFTTQGSDGETLFANLHNY